MSIGIYKFQNKITQQVYIGQSVNLEARYKSHWREYSLGTNKFYQAIQEFGWDNFTYEILEYCAKDELNVKERYWISYYNSYQNGYNSTPGGSNKESINAEAIYTLYDEEYTAQQIADELNIGLSTVYSYLINHPTYCQKTKKDHNLFQYDLNGNFIQAWNTHRDAGIALGFNYKSISKVLSGERNTAGGFQWKKDFFEKIDPVEQTSLPRTIYQYDLQSNFIQSFDSIALAAQGVHGDGSAIRRAANGGLNRTAYGYRWSFEKI